MRLGRKDIKQGLKPSRADLRLPLRTVEAIPHDADPRAYTEDVSPFSSASLKEGRARAGLEGNRGSHTPTLRPFSQHQSASVYQHAKILTTVLGPNISSSTNQSDSIAGSVEVIVSELEGPQDESVELLTAREETSHISDPDLQLSEASDTEIVIRQLIADRDKALANQSEAANPESVAPDLSAFISEIKATQALEEQVKSKERWLLKQTVLKMIGQPSGLAYSDPSDSENSIMRNRTKADDQTPTLRSKSCKQTSSPPSKKDSGRPQQIIKEEQLRQQEADSYRPLAKHKTSSVDLQESPLDSKPFGKAANSKVRNRQIINLALNSLASTNGISRARLEEAIKVLDGFRVADSFVILFSSPYKEDFAGLYHLEDNSILKKLCGEAIYPEVLDLRMIQFAYRFDSSSHCFKKLANKSLSIGTDAVSLVSRRSYY
jgi:hypothetical protein